MAREKNPSSKHRKEARKPGCSERQPNRPSAETLPVLIPEAAGAGQIEEALRQTEQRLALALSGARMGMYDRDIATGQTVCTEQVAQLLGLRTTTTATTTLSQAYDYHDWAERVHPEDRAGVEATLQRCMTERTAYEAEYRVVCPDGTVRWLADRGVFQYGPDGRPARLLGILMDINDRKMAEEALEHANEHLHVQTDELAAMNKRLLTEREELRRRSLELGQLKERADRTARAMERLARSVEENPDPALRVSLEGRIQYKNPAAYALCRQWNPDDTSRVPPAVQEIVSAAYARTETIRREMAFGRRVYRITVAPAPPPAQRVNIFARDITERKQAEEALRENEQRLRSHIENSPLGVVEWDKDFVVTRWAGEMEKMLGWSAREDEGIGLPLCGGP